MTVTETEFQPYAFVKAIIDECPSPDPGECVDAIMAAATENMLRPLLAWALRAQVTKIAGLERRTAARYGDENPGRPGGSRFKGVGVIYKSFVGTTVFTGRVWKFVGECTPEDCEAIRDDRYGLANATMVEGQRWEAFAKLLRDNGAGTLGELDESTVVGVLKWQP